MADEELIRDQKEIAKILALQEEIKQKVADAIREGKETTRVGNRLILNVKLLDEEGSSDDENTIDRYEAESKKGSIKAKAQRNKKNGKIDVDVDFDTNTIKNILDIERKKRLEQDRQIRKHTVDGNDSSVLQREVEKGLTNGNAVRMETRRENTRTETMAMFITRAFGEKDIKDLYRVKGKDPHDFKYVIEKSNGTFKKIDLSTTPEGRNTFQKIWIMRDGKLQEKAVDSLLLKGQYGIATDIPENVASDNTTSYMVQRLPNGQYIGIEVAQASGVNRNTSGNEIQKDLMSKTKSKYQLEDTVEAANLAKQIDPIMKDGVLTAEELELVKKLKEEKNLSDNEVRDTVDTIACLKKMGFECSQIRPMLASWNRDDIEKLSNKVKKGDISKKDIERGTKLPGGGFRDRGYNPRHDE